MNNMALSLSKSLTDYLEQNETRHEKQSSHQLMHEKQLEDLNSRVEHLEKANRDFQEDKKKIDGEFHTIKQNHDVSHKDLITIKSDLERMQTRVNECQDWVRLITALTQEVHNLNETKKSQEKTIEDLVKNQDQLKKQLDRLQRHVTATASTAQAAAATAASASAAVSAATNRTVSSKAPQYCIKTPSRSPSTASFFNGNMNRNQSSTPRFNNLYEHHNHYNGSIDANEALSEMSGHAESLMNVVEDLNENFKELHQRSFDRGSSYSGE